MDFKKVWQKVRRSNYIKKILRLLFIVANKFPAKDTIVFESFLGKQFSDNPKAIYEYIKENYPEYKLYWGVDRRSAYNFPKKEINYLTRLSPKWIWIMATSKYWITNSRLPLWIPKPKHTKYVQTWHGTPLKKLGLDILNVQMAGMNTKLYREEFLKEAKKWDYLISPNAYSTKIFRSAFVFDKTIIESGYPRNDYLHVNNNKNFIAKIKRSLNIQHDKKVILYAPTWRDDDYYDTGKYKFNIRLDLDKLKEVFGDNYILLLRMHYLVAENLNLEAYKGFVYDYSTYNDINDLYLIADLLITDYSSVFFDYANLKRPMLFYVYDIEDYKDNLRGFYFDFEAKAPGPLVKTTEEIIREIETIENGNFVYDEVFYNKFCYLEDGYASKRVVEEIFNS